MKAHGFSASPSTTTPSNRTPPKTPRHAPPAASKKRKLAAAEDPEAETGDDDEFSGNSYNVKGEFGGQGKERFKVEDDVLSQKPFYDAEERYEQGMNEMGNGDIYGLGREGVFGERGYGGMGGYEVPVQMVAGEGEMNPYSFEYQGLVGGAEEGPILVE